MTTTKNNEHKKLNFSSEREQSQACLNSAEHEKNQGRKVLNVPNSTDKGNVIRNVPHLRFPEFEGEWEKCTLEDVMYFSTTRVNSSELNKDNYVSTENMLQDYQGIVDAKSVPEDVNVVSFSCGDILISNIRPYLKKVWKATFNGGCSSDVFVLKANDNIESDYLHYVIANDKFINFVMSGAKGVKMPRGDKKQMETYSLSLPQIQEQHKIARLISLLDERIATQNKIIDKLQSLIKGIADKLFQTARTTKPLLEFAPNITSGTDKSGSGTIPLYGSTGIIGTVKNASQKGNIVLVARVGTIGTVQYVNEPCGVSDNALIVEAGEMTKYIYHFLKTYNFTRITSGTTQPLITASSLKKAAIPTYDIESQTRIVLCLNGLEKKLDMAKQYLSDIAVMKQYLLRQMFI